MKKTLLLALVMTAIVCHAQITNFPWSETFYPGSTMDGFSFYDNDGDGYGWETVTVFTEGGTGHNGSNGWLYSWSDNYYGSHTQDNLMVLPSFYIPNNTTNYVLTWYDRGQNGDYYVYISTSGRNINTFINSSPNYAYHVSSVGYGEGWGTVWEKRTINLSSYAGQTINIAFRHYNSGSTGISIDDIRVGSPSNVDPTEPTDPLDPFNPDVNMVDFVIDTLGYMINSYDSTTVTLCCTFNRNIASVVIPANIIINDTSYIVTIIGDNAFCNINNLTSVSIPATIDSIKNSAFANTNITSISLSDNLKYIGGSAFSGCTRLSSVVTPNTVTSIGDGAFMNCSSMTGVSLSTALSSIGSSTFSGCSSLNSVSLGTNIVYIGESAFLGCEMITSISIPNNVVTVGGSAFRNCNGLTTVTIGSGVETLGDMVFNGCTNITTINYNAEDCRNAIGTFQGMSSLTTLNMGNNVRYIPSNMFKNCTGLVTLRIPDAVTEIGSGAFQGCVNLTNATLGSGLTSISSSCFEDCLRLMNVRLGDALSYIGANAFRNCGIVGELIVPQGVISIGERAFSECYGVNTITALGRVAPVLEYETNYYGETSNIGPFFGIDSNITVNIPCGTTNMYAGRWPQFHNYSEMPFLFNAISENISKGTVTVEQEPTCDNPYALIRATPKVGYHFDHWSDGNTSNPYSYTATGSVTLIAYFAENVGIASAKLDDNGISITVENGQIVVHGDYTGLVRVFDIMGRLVASAKAGEVLPAMPNGVYIVQIGKTIAKKVVILR